MTIPGQRAAQRIERAGVQTYRAIGRSRRGNPEPTGSFVLSLPDGKYRWSCDGSGHECLTREVRE